MNPNELCTILQSVASQCIAVRVRLLNRVICGVFDEVLRPFGMKVSQMNIMVAVSLTGPVKPSQVCEALQMDPSTFSRNAERMRKQGWLEYLPGEDQRSHTVQVTASGLKLIEDCLTAWQEAQNRVKSMIGEEQAQALNAIADALWATGSVPRE